jgi:hypothetical protein
MSSGSYGVLGFFTMKKQQFLIELVLIHDCIGLDCIGGGDCIGIAMKIGALNCPFSILES